MASSLALTLDVSSPDASPNLTVLRFAAGFYHDVRACSGAHEVQALHRRYRDRILAVDGLAANIAAALRPLLQTDEPAALRTASEARRWAELDEVAQRATNKRDRESQKLRCQSAIVAAWGPDVFHHYGWQDLPLDLVRRLHDLAVLMPRWEEVVQVLNSYLLARHESRVLHGRNRDFRIGEHSTSSTVQDPRSPVERRDILAALEWAREKARSPEARCRVRNAVLEIDGTPIKHFGLQRDAYGMVVPSAALPPAGPRPTFPGLLRRPAATPPGADEGDSEEHNPERARSRRRRAAGQSSDDERGPSVTSGEASPSAELALARWRASGAADVALSSHSSPSARTGPIAPPLRLLNDASAGKAPPRRKRLRQSAESPGSESQEDETERDGPSPHKRPRTSSAETLPNQSDLPPRQTRRPSTPSDYVPRAPAPSNAEPSHPVAEQGSSSDDEDEDAEAAQDDRTPTATAAIARDPAKRRPDAVNAQRRQAVNEEDEQDNDDEEEEDEQDEEEDEQDEEEDEQDEQDEQDEDEDEEEREEREEREEDEEDEGVEEDGRATLRGEEPQAEIDKDVHDEREDGEDNTLQSDTGARGRAWRREHAARREETESTPRQTHESDNGDDEDDNIGSDNCGDDSSDDNGNEHTENDTRKARGSVKDIQCQPSKTPPGAYAEQRQDDAEPGGHSITSEFVRAALAQNSPHPRPFSRFTEAVTPSSLSSQSAVPSPTTHATPVPPRPHIDDPHRTSGNLTNKSPSSETTAAAAPATLPAPRPPPPEDESHGSSSSEDTLLHDIRSRYSPVIERLVREASRADADPDVQHQRKLQLEWLRPGSWASIYAEPQEAIGKSSTPAEEADVWYLSWEALRDYVDRGFVFDRPVVVKQSFRDSGMYNLEDYMAMLWQRFADQDIDVQNSQTGLCSSISMADYCMAVSKLDLTSSDSATRVSNALNLGRMARADEPLLTRLPRFRLLSTLVDRLNGVVGKNEVAKPADIESSLHFNLLGFSGAFSRSHVDYLVGTWVRCLFGSKVWMIASQMQEEDWQRFARDGCNWSPEGKGRILVLEQDDVLLMPPGLRTVHAVLTPEPSLVEGGMLWDEVTIPQILEGLLWIGKNQACTNEPVAYQLPGIIDALEQWAEQFLDTSSSEDEQDVEYTSAVRDGIRALRALGCACGLRCESSADCICKREQRRCTSWCLRHPLLQPREMRDDESAPRGARTKNKDGGSFYCMHD